jgi:hypothetical protein
MAFYFITTKYILINEYNETLYCDYPNDSTQVDKLAFLFRNYLNLCLVDHKIIINLRDE